MNYKETLAEAVKQGAIRVYSASNGWHVVYRVQDGQMQARNLNKIGENEWALGATMAGWAAGDSDNGWLPVQKVHFGVQSIELEAAKQNPGFYYGLLQRCETCRQEKSTLAFSRDMTSEEGRRTWECNQCATERATEVHAAKAVRGGDVIRRESHASVPPVKSEI